MRRLVILATLTLSACGTAPTTPEPTPTPPPAQPVQPRETGELIGLSATDLTTRMGRPALQIREGNSVKVQYRSSRCVLDAFLYPSPRGDYRVTHVEARTEAGIDTDKRSCISALLYPS